jgi:hypothetical protein
MAAVVRTINTQISNSRSVDTAATNSLVLISGSSETIQQIKIDNSGNTTKCFLALFDASSTGGVTLGTTHPRVVLPVEAATTVQYAFETSISFSSGIVQLVSTSAGTPGGSPGAPSSVLTVEILFS